jgi:alanyl-tRNA synthetase
MKSREVREAFISFFKSKGHTFAPASPVVPQNDPTILFTNAGMNQFKDVFLGTGTRPYTRAVNSQVCIRVSGKHNDLEDVGFDTTHLTLFEMLGNWSFGDYYKKESIEWAWELFTQVFKLPADKLYATVYKDDAESAELWKSITAIKPEHVLFFGNKDNFWEMGEVGPCGPCSELHLDRGPDACDKKGIDHVCEVNGTCTRYIELWNLVFIQYNRQADGTLIELPNKHVDTGAGLERLVAYLQGTTSNYETDLFKPILDHIVSITGIAYTGTPEGMPHRVMADHTRTITFAIADNVLPSNEGRGYVIRRLLRRALRYAAKLGIHRPILFELVDSVIDSLGDHFTHLAIRKDFIKTVVKSEEEQFLKTLEAGIGLFEQVSASLKTSGQTKMPGAEAFKLYDTYGFPLDLTQVMAKEVGLDVDDAEFTQCLDAQKKRSRDAYLASKNKQENTSETGDDDSDETSIRINQTLLSPNPPKTVPMGGEARIVTRAKDRVGMARHHTGTHLLQAALRDILGDHVYQAGSLVDTERLRFDFSHFQAVDVSSLKAIEDQVNAIIQQGIAVETFEKPIEEAKAMGAMALFGEKYDDIVRVVKIGETSMELCVGTHMANTKDIECFKIIQETAVAAGTRRIEALAGKSLVEAYDHACKAELLNKIQAKSPQIEQFLTALTQCGITQADPRVSLEGLSYSELDIEDKRLTECVKSLEKQWEAVLASQAAEQAKTLVTLVNMGKTVSFILSELPQASIQYARTLADAVTHSRNDVVVVLAFTQEGKSGVLVKCGPGVSGSIKATDYLEVLTRVAGGKGGGKPQLAQAGGIDSAKIGEAFEALREVL